MLDVAQLLDRMPRGVRRLAYRVAEGRGILGRVADAVRFRYSAADIPVLPPVAGTDVRLAIGPANSAGQGFQWARAVERTFPAASAVSIHGIAPGPFLPEADLRVPVPVYQRSRDWQDRFEDFLGAQTHVIWESGLPLLGRRYRSDVMAEVAKLGRRGVKGGLLFHGSDIRPPSLHAAQSPWSPFRDPTGPVRLLEDTVSKNADLVERSGLPVFVSTPDLLRWMPDAVWLPVVVDAARWRSAAIGREASRIPVVAHAPSQKWLKGTDLIEPVLRRLSEEGVIEYRRVVNVDHATMPEFYAEADIVLDQFVLGIYGVAACEAMASGRLVMSHVDAFTREQVAARTGLDLPVHEVTIDTLETELRRAAADLGAFESLRRAGPAFVEQVHDGRRSGSAIAGFLGLSA